MVMVALLLWPHSLGLPPVLEVLVVGGDALWHLSQIPMEESQHWQVREECGILRLAYVLLREHILHKTL